MTSPLPKYSIITSDKDLNYLVAINNDKKYNFHYLRDDRVAVLRDCYEDGSLKTIKKNERKCKNPYKSCERLQESLLFG